MRIFLIGFMGSGKTYWGKKIADRMQIPFFDLDEVITGREQMPVADIFQQHGEEYFRFREKAALEELIEEQPSMVLSCGGGTPCFFNNIAVMKKHGVVVWLNTSVDILQERLLRAKASRPLISGIADSDMKTYIIRKLGERKMYYEQADVILNNEGSISINEIIQHILHA